MRPAVVPVSDRLGWSVPIAIGVKLRHGADPREYQDARRGGDNRQHRHLDFLLLDLLAQVLRRPPHHQAGDEYRDNAVQNYAVEPRADASEDHLAGHDVEERHQPREWRKAIVPAVHGAAAGIGRYRREQRRIYDAETGLIAFHAAAAL